ncbi:MAG: chromosomal replication initiator protein DnaA [bacterium]
MPDYNLPDVDNLLKYESVNKLWIQCLDQIKSRIPPTAFKTWFGIIELSSIKNYQAVIDVPSSFYADFVDANYKDIIEQSFLNILNRQISIKYNIRDFKVEKGAALKAAEHHFKQKDRPKDLDQFKSGYTFENFIIGDSNQMAQAAAMAVSEAPGKNSFNPLIIYGGTGLGKTHLLQAIGHFALINDTAEKVVYVTSEQFLNEFVKHVYISKNAREFYTKYRHCDLLLLDDIQFFSGKEGIQEQFFSIFNSLLGLKKQIVITSDRDPKQIPKMTARLLSRFHSGLQVGVQPPDFETRMAIIKQKAEHDNINLSEDVYTYIATKIKSNVRELEGCIIKLLAFSSFTGNPINLENVKEILGDTVPLTKNQLTMNDIQNLVAGEFDILEAKMRAHSRCQKVTLPRQVCMYLARKYTNLSNRAIGHFFARDYSTVIHACKKILETTRQDREIRQKLESLEQKLMQSVTCV